MTRFVSGLEGVAFQSQGDRLLGTLFRGVDHMFSDHRRPLVDTVAGWLVETLSPADDGTGR